MEIWASGKIDKGLTLQNLVTRRIRQSPTENFNFREKRLPSPGKHPATSGPSVKTCLLWKVTLLVIRRIRQLPAEKILENQTCLRFSKNNLAA